MQRLDPNQIARLTALRHELHAMPELSGEEGETARRIAAELESLGADRIWRDLGGHGVAAEFRGRAPGPTVLFRCELDGLPIRELSHLPYRSRCPGKGHLCGHDGHMVSMLGVATALAARPLRGRVIVLFQPAEETGAGAAAVIADPRWPEIRPDLAFAYHNLPGRPLGEIGLRAGPGNCASRGMRIRFEGRSSHAAAPQDGLSPGPAMAALMTALPALGRGNIAEADYALVTLTHAQLGAPSFGIAPGEGEVRVTLRTRTNDRMEALIGDALAEVERAAGGLKTEVDWHDVFHAVTNDAGAVDIARDAATSLGQTVHEMATPMSWSEDFGRIGEDGAQAAMIYVGAGEAVPQLHNPDYDFPDALLPGVIDLFCAITGRILGPPAP